mmetsp:Transcript_2802/g.2967  ORF Transcript_2802/g.2967 Transcript_2802/m.2967 type:complete len:144 (+) Transcript_2802:115-546(+)|eukprot:CAMPEP_0182423792 /NCGR_PEP_ID=MMETSP1167-20130531/9870_1 /TAXON_ID=2988 /ORGANISM="Mallomonas Sp, Strain CCMP3275" /LENGTH=143 /DNA_ID=CAMNT_0024603067 /DNA_START=108 /DNA_END=539 /DNA_ORIENTATION=-
MFVSKKNRIKVYSYLFKEGTLVAKKDKYAKKHSDELPVPNLEVMALLKSFASKKYVKETFNWQYYYYYLTNEGIEYLREYLALPDDIVPATLKKAAPRPSRPGEAPREDGDKGKSVGPDGEFNPEFRQEGGFGRGRDGYRRER